jgi:Bifunctional DNA primase/polymerase, N-terminal
MMPAPIDFATVALGVAERGWRPFPGWQETKVPAMRGWPGLNEAEWDWTDLIAAIAEYQPTMAYCCCLAVQPEIVAIDIDITNPGHADIAAKLADEHLGTTPLVRIGLAPKAFAFTATATV